MAEKLTTEDNLRAHLMAAEVRGLRTKRDRVRLPVEVDLFDLFRVIGALQLAWRNPSLDEPMRQSIERFGRQLQCAFDAHETPQLALTLEQGWHREFDR